MPADTEAADPVNQLGICPVVVQSYGEIATVLEETYCAAVDDGDRQRVELANPRAY